MQVSSLFRKSAAFLSVRLLGTMLSFAMFSLLARVMTTTDFGLFSMVFSTILLLVPVLSLGRREIAQRFIPSVRASGDQEAARNITIEGWKMIGRSFALFALASLIVIAGLWRWGGVDHSVLVLILGSGLLLCATLAAEYQMHVLRGYGKIGRAVVPRDIYWRGLILILTLIFLLAGLQLTAIQAVLVIGGCLMLVVIGQALNNSEVHPNGAMSSPPLQADAARAARLLYLPNLLNTGFPNLVPIIVGLFVSPANSAILFISQRIVNLMNMPHMANQSVVINAISALHARGEHAEIQRQIPKQTALIFSISVAIFIVIVLFGSLILSVFGSSYAEHKDILIIMGIGPTLNTMFGPLGVTMQIFRYEHYYSRALIICNISALLLLLLATYLFGIYGAAWASTIQVLIWNISLWVLIRKVGLPDVSVMGLIFHNKALLK